MITFQENCVMMVQNNCIDDVVFNFEVIDMHEGTLTYIQYGMGV
jgi:hypothetical protein